MASATMSRLDTAAVEGLLHGAGDVHWTPECHARVAERVAAELRKQGWLSEKSGGR